MRRRFASMGLALATVVAPASLGVSAAAGASKPPKVCRVASSAMNKSGGSDLLGLDPETATTTRDALRAALKLADDRASKKAINALLRVYTELAKGSGAKARKSLERYLAKHCTGALDVDPCVLVSLDDAQTLAGTPLEPGVEGDPTNPSCTYHGPISGPTAQVEVYLGAGGKKVYDIDRDLGHVFTPITGLDEAYTEPNGAFVHQGGLWVAVLLVRLNDSAQNTPALEDLARKIANEL